MTVKELIRKKKSLRPLLDMAHSFEIQNDWRIDSREAGTVHGVQIAAFDESGALLFKTVVPYASKASNQIETERRVRWLTFALWELLQEGKKVLDTVKKHS